MLCHIMLCYVMQYYIYYTIIYYIILYYMILYYIILSQPLWQTLPRDHPAEDSVRPVMCVGTSGLTATPVNI